jgi:PAS domain S-box-containing protein
MHILPDYSYWPLRAKLVSIIMLSSAVCLLVSLSVLAVSSASSRYHDSLDQLSALAEVLAENCQAALVFSDKAEASRLLDSLAGHREISAAWLVAENGDVLASWSRQGGGNPVPADYQGQAIQLHSDFWSRHADLYKPVKKEKELIGYVLLKADYSERWQRQLLDFAEGLGAGVLALLVVFLLSYRLQRVITRPLEEIAEAAHTIAHDNSYELRVPQRTHDEIGDLVLSFNNMLREIQARDENLIHQRDHLEKEVAKRTEELRTIVENSPDTIARYDRELRRTYVNPAFGSLTEGGNDVLLGKKPSEYPGGPNSRIYEAKINDVLATGEDTIFELKWPGKAGKEIYSQIRLTAERDVSGNITSVLGVGHDITELKEYQAELQRKELAKTRFLAAAGHDMRQPLAAANLFVDALKYTETSAEQIEIIQRLELAMSNFNTLLDALLNVSKLDAGMIKPDYAPIGVTELLSWVEQNLAPLAMEKKIGFKLYFPMRESLVVVSDIGLIQSVLMNLVSNAIKFTSKGGILLSARQRGNEVLFQVWDTGMGIEHEHRLRVFEEFYQVDNQQRDRSQGLGLGLSIVKRALLLLDQEITCHSQFGRGSVFGFSLPLDVETYIAPLQDLAVAPQAGEDPAVFVQGKLFVVVEDDTLLAEALSKSLQGMGGVVKVFHRAEAALNDAGNEDADCFIVDFMLGGALDGIQFLNLLQQNLGKPVIGVIMTGDTSTAFVRDAAHCTWPVLHKPVSITKLVNSIRTLMR